MASESTVLVFSFAVLIFTVTGYNYSEINLHPDHIKFYFNVFKDVAKKCLEDETCPYKVSYPYILFLNGSSSRARAVLDPAMLFHQNYHRPIILILGVLLDA